MNKDKVILSTSLLLEEGTFTNEKVTLEEAKTFAKDAINFVGHSTIKILNIEPSKTREACQSYGQALVLKVKGRIEFGKEYTKEEIEAIGVDFFLITKQS